VALCNGAVLVFVLSFVRLSPMRIDDGGGLSHRTNLLYYAFENKCRNSTTIDL